MSKSIAGKCPFHREGTASRKIFLALAAARKPLTADEVAKAAKISGSQSRTLLRAYRNRFHFSTMVRAGIRLNLKDGKFWLALCKPDLKARRPERGKAKKEKRGTKKAEKASKAPKTKRIPVTPPVPAAAPAEGAGQAAGSAEGTEEKGE